MDSSEQQHTPMKAASRAGSIIDIETSSTISDNSTKSGTSVRTPSRSRQPTLKNSFGFNGKSYQGLNIFETLRSIPENSEQSDGSDTIHMSPILDRSETHSNPSPPSPLSPVIEAFVSEPPPPLTDLTVANFNANYLQEPGPGEPGSELSLDVPAVDTSTFYQEEASSTQQATTSISTPSVNNDRPFAKILTKTSDLVITSSTSNKKFIVQVSSEDQEIKNILKQCVNIFIHQLTKPVQIGGVFMEKVKRGTNKIMVTVGFKKHLEAKSRQNLEIIFNEGKLRLMSTMNNRLRGSRLTYFGLRIITNTMQTLCQQLNIPFEKTPLTQSECCELAPGLNPETLPCEICGTTRHVLCLSDTVNECREKCLDFKLCLFRPGLTEDDVKMSLNGLVHLDDYIDSASKCV